jgi:hypothetical protein
MIEDASNGITASRKKLAQLGPSATMDDIRPLLQDVPWNHLRRLQFNLIACVCQGIFFGRPDESCI